MAATTTNMSLTVWNSLTDPYDSSQLVDNFVKLDGHTHESGKGLPIPNGGLLSTSGSEAVNTNVIRAGAVTTAKLETYTSGTTGVTTIKIADSAVTEAKIATDAITTTKIKNSTGNSDGVTTTKLADGAVTTVKIADSTGTSDGVTNAKLATASVTTAKLADSTSSTTGVTTAKLADTAVTKAKLDLVVQGSVPTYVTSLPPSPTDGQEIYYQASSTDESSVVTTSVWHLRYRSVTSVTSGTGVAIGTGTGKILNVTSTTGFVLGDYVKVALNSTNYFEGYITAISNTSVTINSIYSTGSGTATTISLAYPWEAVGGRPTSKYNFNNTVSPTGTGVAASTWYGSWNGETFAKLTVPLAGQYDINYGATSLIGDSTHNFSGTYAVGLGLGASTSPVDGSVGYLPYNTSVTGNLISASQFSKETFTSSTTSGNRLIRLYVRYSSAIGTYVYLTDQRLTLTPVRLADWS